MSVVLTLKFRIKDPLMKKERKETKKKLSHLLKVITHQGAEKLDSNSYVLTTVPLRYQPFSHPKYKQQSQSLLQISTCKEHYCVLLS